MDFFCLLLYPAFTSFEAWSRKKSKKSHAKSLYIRYMKPRSSSFQVCNSIEALLLSRSTKENLKDVLIVESEYFSFNMLMFLKGIHKVVFIFYYSNNNKKGKKRKAFFFSFFSFLSLFFGGCQNEQLHRIPLSRSIHSSSNSNSMSEFSNLLLIVFKR